MKLHSWKSWISMFLIAGALSLAHSPTSAQETSASGTTPPGTTLSEIIRSAIREGKHRLEIAPGVYRQKDSLLLDNVSNLEIAASGVTLIMTQPRTAVEIRKCEGLKIQGLTIDYDPLPFTQGTITAIEKDGAAMEFQVHEGYPDLKPDMAPGVSRHFFDKQTRLWKEGANLFARPRLDIVTPRKGRALFESPQRKVEVGDYIAFDRRVLDPVHGVYIKDCTGTVELDGVTIHASGSLGIIARSCTGQLTFRRIKIERGPRPAGATEDRLISTNADGINCAECRTGPLIEGCDLSFMGDDSLNVHGPSFPVMRVLSPTEVLVAFSHGPKDFARTTRKGDCVQILASSTFETLGTSELKSITTLTTPGDITPEQVLERFPAYKAQKRTITVYRVEFARPSDFLKSGQWLQIPAINCPNFIVKNSYFHDHRARGLRIQASGGLVEGNRFERIGTCAIQVGPEQQFWREAGWVQGIQIIGNTIKDVGFSGDTPLPSCYTPGAITVCARTDAGQPPFSRENKNLLIKGNTIEECRSTGIYVYGADDVKIVGNTIRKFKQYDTSKTGKNYALSVQNAIDLQDVSRAEVKDNTIEK